MSSEATSRELTTKTSPVTISRLGWLFIAIGATILATLQTGCGATEGPGRIPVTGKVNLDDAPLSSGIIRFVPVDDAGGPGAATKIVAGEFEFSSDNGPVIANHRVEIEATDFQDFAIDDEAAFAAAAEATGRSPVAVNPVPAIYNSRSTLTARVTDADGQSFTFDLKTQQ
ncbi:MAG: hypothetical protein R3C17_19685 [Planctomycetaceae bacterium]